MTEHEAQRRPEFVEPELIKHEEKLADITLLNGYGDIAVDDDFDDADGT